MTLEERYGEASAQAAHKKAAFLSSVTEAKARIAPARLKEDVKEGMSNGGAYVAAKVQERPIAAGAAAGALLLYLFRRPLWALFRRTYVRVTNHIPETTETHDG